MKISRTILDEICMKNAKLVAVTKYFDSKELNKIFEQLKSEKCFLSIGENRIESIQEKNIPREYCHFIGNVQSRKIVSISEHCSAVHSLDSIKHAELFAKQENPPAMFIQINISNEPQKGGVLLSELEDFIQNIPTNLIVLGISAMGENTSDTNKKSQEFLKLIEIRDHYNKEWKISAGTSVDYQEALDAGIDIVRVGRALFEID